MSSKANTPMRAAILGVGFMGWIHKLAYQRSATAELVGFASRDAKKRAGDWRGIQGNFGPPGEQWDVSGLNVSENLDGLLEDDSIDLIDVCLPPHLHVDAIKKILASGKKVLCEKPLALTSEAARSLLDVAEPGQLMVAHILPFMPAFRFLVEAQSDGRFGNPITGRFSRTISPPDWIPDFYDPEKVGGPLIDLQVHDAHLARVLFGMPTAAHCVSHNQQGVPKRYETILEYTASADSDGATPVVSLAGGVIDSPARGFTHGYEVSFEKATVRFEFAAYGDGSSDTIPLTVMHNDGKLERPDLGEQDPIDGFVSEIDAAAEVVAGGSLHPVLDAQLATDALTICEMQMASRRS
ncbi:Gfo/Idh/MocA family protein [Rhodopirellula europaea]|uniref:Oxidoreductase domain protein n=1 Tax=Rhodopirellula europaea 6C TaxID=1263867 RepID=M2AE59_9BACT|nr:Gfo/Idh/MocA family oxidoreductase [Rhodopirellula europaea]EMB15410.1 oxidoreductase domain protein [Rhodopirellula europaea 6C]|tara:strand:- start:5043 stop:6101 length:1059 start_codon:yes stop_codon:yes gene_type:complete